MKKKSKLLEILTVLFFILAVIMVLAGLNKKIRYESPDYSDGVNAYVGGDAYNYIINSNYTTGYYVLAVGAFLAGVMCIAANEIIIRLPAQDNVSIGSELPPL